MAVYPTDQTPLTIPSASACVLWMRPDDTSSSNMTASGNRLSAIKNLANNTILISNGVSANQPATGVATINGLNALQFDNDNNRWLTTGLASTLTNLSIFTVVQKFVTTSQGHVFAGSGASQSIRLSTTDAIFTSNDGTTSITATGGSSILTTPAILGLTCDVAGATRNLYKSSATVNATGSYDGTIGSQFFGSIAASSGNARGGYNQGETIIYNKALSSTEITTIMRYLANRWGIILT